MRSGGEEERGRGECERCLLFEPAEDLMTRTSGCTRSSFKFYRNFIDRRDNFSPLFTSFFPSFAALRANLSFFAILWGCRDCFSPLPPTLSPFVEEKKNETPLLRIEGERRSNCGVFLDIITLVRHEPTSGTRFEVPLIPTWLSINYSRNYSSRSLLFSLSLFLSSQQSSNREGLGAAIMRIVNWKSGSRHDIVRV